MTGFAPELNCRYCHYALNGSNGSAYKPFVSILSGLIRTALLPTCNDVGVVQR